MCLPARNFSSTQPALLLMMVLMTMMVTMMMVITTQGRLDARVAGLMVTCTEVASLLCAVLVGITAITGGGGALGSLLLPGFVCLAVCVKDMMQNVVAGEGGDGGARMGATRSRIVI